MIIPIEVPMTVSSDAVVIPMNVETQPEISMTLGATYAMSTAEPYEGIYTITPSRQAQVLDIKDKKATDNIVIEAIPSNYGLITKQGNIITVS